MITIIDHGYANIANIKNAFDHLGIDCNVTRVSEDIISAEKIVLPGVGAFSAAMERLEQTGIADALKFRAMQGIPVLGICLGMQLLFTSSEENGNFPGLDIIPGKVEKIKTQYKIPHIGWNDLKIVGCNPLFTGISSGEFVYFVHSFHCIPGKMSLRSAVAEYGCKITAAVSYRNIFGTQFHPEKSQNTGLRILKNFGEIKL